MLALRLFGKKRILELGDPYGSIEAVMRGRATPVEVDQTTARKILGAMQWIGYAIAVGMLIYVGIKYVTSAAEERANLKNTMIYYVIGTVLIVAATTVVSVISHIRN